MNFYKITNEQEIHHGMKYKTGLNTDILPFYPSGCCSPGGIYFAREDILAFLSYGPWIRQVTIPLGEPVYEDPKSEPKKWKAHRVMLGKRRKITANVIRELIKEGANPKTEKSEALRWAAGNGHLEIVKELIPVSDPKADESEALRLAAKNGHLEIVKELIPVSDPKAYKSWALRWAAENGHLEVVKELIPVSDPEVVKEL